MEKRKGRIILNAKKTVLTKCIGYKKLITFAENQEY
jgi:hypothetical protein